MPPKRKNDESFKEPRKVTYADEVELLQCLIHEMPASYSDIKETDAEKQLIIKACKLVYILYHDIEAHDCLDSLLQPLLSSAERDVNTGIKREAKLKQSAWKGQILNKFFLPHVKEMKRKWEIAHPYAGFASLPSNERVSLWMEAYDTDPKSMATKMFKPVIMAIDLNSVFRRDLISEDKRRMSAIRAMLRRKYWFGCDITYRYGVATESKGKIMDGWAKYAQIEEHASSIMPIAHIPVSPDFSGTGCIPKKMKKSMVSESDTLSSSAVPERITLGLSPASLITLPSERDIPPRSEFSLQTSSVIASFPAPERQNNRMKHIASDENPLVKPQPCTEALSPTMNKTSVLAGLGEGKELKPTLPSKEVVNVTNSSEVDDSLL